MKEMSSMSGGQFLPNMYVILARMSVFFPHKACRPAFSAARCKDTWTWLQVASKQLNERHSALCNRLWTRMHLTEHLPASCLALRAFPRTMDCLCSIQALSSSTRCAPTRQKQGRSVFDYQYTASRLAALFNVSSQGHSW